MSTTPEATNVVTPPASPAPAPATAEHISALHRHLDELGSFLGEKFKQLAALVEKAAPAVEAAAVAVAPLVGAPVAGVVSVVEKVAGALACCKHVDRQHDENGKCQVCSTCTGNKPAAA